MTSDSDLETSLLKRLAAKNETKIAQVEDQSSPDHLSKLIHEEFDFNEPENTSSPLQNDSNISS